MIQAERVRVKEVPRVWRWARLAVLLVSGYLIWVLVRGIGDIRQAYRRIDEARGRLAVTEAKNEVLKKKLVEVQTREYVERVARDELLMQQEGETVVVLPRIDEAAAKADQGEVKEEEIPNYLKWWRLIE